MATELANVVCISGRVPDDLMSLMIQAALPSLDLNHDGHLTSDDLLATGFTPAFGSRDVMPPVDLEPVLRQAGGCLCSAATNLPANFDDIVDGVLKLAPQLGIDTSGLPPFLLPTDSSPGGVVAQFDAGKAVFLWLSSSNFFCSAACREAVALLMSTGFGESTLRPTCAPIPAHCTVPVLFADTIRDG